MNNLDPIDSKLLAARIAARNAIQKPLVGDYVYFKSGQLERFSHDWGDGLQTSPGGSFYLFESGRASFSGGLNPATPLQELKVSSATLPGSFWIFHHGIAGAHRGVYFDIPCNVFLTTAEYTGFLGDTFKSPSTMALIANLQRQLSLTQDLTLEQATA